MNQNAALRRRALLYPPIRGLWTPAGLSTTWKSAFDCSVPGSFSNIDGSGFLQVLQGVGFGSTVITNFQQATQARKPHAGATDFNSVKPGMIYLGTDDCMQRTSNGEVYLSGAGTVYTLTRGIPGVGAAIYSESSQTVANVNYIPIKGHASVNTSLAALIRDASTVALADTVALATNVFSTSPVLIGVIDSGSSLTPRINGTQGSATAYTRPGAMGTLDRVAIAALFNGVTTPTLAATCEMAMVFTLGRVMTQGECERFEGWVAWHPTYAGQITLPAGHPYKNVGPT